MCLCILGFLTQSPTHTKHRYSVQCIFCLISQQITQLYTQGIFQSVSHIHILLTCLSTQAFSSPFKLPHTFSISLSHTLYRYPITHATSPSTRIFISKPVPVSQYLTHITYKTNLSAVIPHSYYTQNMSISTGVELGQSPYLH